MNFSAWFRFQVKPHLLLSVANEAWNGVRVIIEQVLRDNFL